MMMMMMMMMMMIDDDDDDDQGRKYTPVLRTISGNFPVGPGRI